MSPKKRKKHFRFTICRHKVHEFKTNLCVCVCIVEEAGGQEAWWKEEEADPEIHSGLHSSRGGRHHGCCQLCEYLHLHSNNIIVTPVCWMVYANLIWIKPNVMLQYLSVFTEGKNTSPLRGNRKKKSLFFYYYFYPIKAYFYWLLILSTSFVFIACRRSSCKSVLRWTAKLGTLVEGWSPLRGARVKLPWTQRFPSQKGIKCIKTLSCCRSEQTPSQSRWLLYLGGGRIWNIWQLKINSCV